MQSQIIRNVTKKNIETIEYIEYIDVFPGIKEIELNRMPSRDDIINLFPKTNFSLVKQTTINQLFAKTNKEYLEKLSKRGLSGFRLISDEAFNKGMHQLRKRLKDNDDQNGIFEEIDLFIFKRIYTDDSLNYDYS